MNKNAYLCTSFRRNMHKKSSTRERLHCIQQIVATQPIERQDELIRELEGAGFHCTQSMLSRDLRQLRISKVRRKDGTSVYVLPAEGHFTEIPSRQEQDNRKWSLQFSGNMAVLHTPPGHASMVAYKIDAAHDRTFLGTLAGDDTILVILAEGATHEDARAHIKHIVKNLR